MPACFPSAFSIERPAKLERTAPERCNASDFSNSLPPKRRFSNSDFSSGVIEFVQPRA